MVVVIIGTGVMASGIAQVLCASEEISQIKVIGRTKEKAEVVKNSCNKGILRLCRKGKLTDKQVEVYSSKLQTYKELSCVSGSQLVIEAVSEDNDVKMDLFREVGKLVAPTTIVASNTSSLSITEFASVLPNPKNVVGLHFFNPAQVMELVEIVVGHETSLEVVEKMKLLTSSICKVPVIVNESPGFVVNRMLIPMINEAISILADGVACAEDIDKAMKFGAHHPMGPLALADLIGNDVNLSIMNTLYSETGDPKYRPHPLLKKMVRANHLGRKTKKGFFEY